MKKINQVRAEARTKREAEACATLKAMKVGYDRHTVGNEFIGFAEESLNFTNLTKAAHRIGYSENATEGNKRDAATLTRLASSLDRARKIEENTEHLANVIQRYQVEADGMTLDYLGHEITATASADERLRADMEAGGVFISLLLDSVVEMVEAMTKNANATIDTKDLREKLNAVIDDATADAADQVAELCRREQNEG